uniref:C2H2-type domain-containing protein n=1 Tax=Schistocephalus solidus TaxID=70667 RepID=A0A183TH17_SCHSO
LKKSLKQLHINPANWKDLVQDRPESIRSAKTGSAVYEANRIATAKAKGEARKSPAPRTNIVDAKALPTCQCCQCIIRAQIGLVGHLRTQCTSNPKNPTSTTNSTNPHLDFPSLTPGINSITSNIKETTSQYSSPVTPTTATIPTFAFTTTTTPISDRALFLTVLNAKAHLPHASVWSVTGKSIVKRLVNQCLEQQNTAEMATIAKQSSPIHSLHGHIRSHAHP